MELLKCVFLHVLLLVNFNDPMYNGDVPASNFENENLSGVNRVLLVISEKEEITTVECRLHTPTVCV